MKDSPSMRQSFFSGILCFILLFLFAVPVNAEGIYQDAPATGCKMWNPGPEPRDSFSWNGECKDGYLDGFGIVQYFTDGKPVGKYEGFLVRGKRSGKGLVTWANGNRYEGDWLDDKMQGKGLMTSNDGASYNGDWVNDKMHGYGVYTWTNGIRYEGNWVEGTMQGTGVLKYPDGREQRGNYENSKFTGP